MLNQFKSKQKKKYQKTIKMAMQTSVQYYTDCHPGPNAYTFCYPEMTPSASPNIL